MDTKELYNKYIVPFLAEMNKDEDILIVRGYSTRTGETSTRNNYRPHSSGRMDVEAILKASLIKD